MKTRQLVYLLYGMATFVPGVNRIRLKGTGGTDSARYCYSIWLRHLVMAKQNRLNPYPKIVAELGPGDSLGIGLAALISGSERYFAFDIVKYANAERNTMVFDELVALFENRTPIPGEDEFPDAKPYLDNYDFPADILDEQRLRRALEKPRIEKIRDSIRDLQQKDSVIQYKVPWYRSSIVEKESVDMIYSQAVLEHVDTLRDAYKAMHSWLKPRGYISHQVDFKSHGLADKWNGHWAYSDFVWKLIRGKRPYLLNREPHSTHIRYLTEEGFRIVCDKKVQLESHFSQNDLAPKFMAISDEDLITSGAFIQAVKQTESA